MIPPNPAELIPTVLRQANGDLELVIRPRRKDVSRCEVMWLATS